MGGAETIIWKGMENGSPSRRWVGVNFFDQVLRFRIETCLGGGLELLNNDTISNKSLSGDWMPH